MFTLIKKSDIQISWYAFIENNYSTKIVLPQLQILFTFRSQILCPTKVTGESHVLDVFNLYDPMKGRTKHKNIPIF